MDYDNDGIQDIISGSYDPGDIYLIPGLGEGEYGQVRSLMDENLIPLVHHPVEMESFMSQQANGEKENIQDRVASFGSWAAPFDWDDDGDLDILIGSFTGGMYLRKNIGTRDDPEYSGESLPVLADGEPLTEESHANPVLADWDEDGLDDLVVSDGNGGVGWYRNIGSKSAPVFGKRELLIEAPATSIFMMQYLFPEDEPTQGSRAQICVHDYNGDGRLDLLVGDHSEIYRLPEMSKEEQSELRALISGRNELMNSSLAAQKRLGMKVEAGEMTQEEADKELKEFQDSYKEKAKSFARIDEIAGKSKTASFVWLYLRKPGTPEGTSASGKSAASSHLSDAN